VKLAFVDAKEEIKKYTFTIISSLTKRKRVLRIHAKRFKTILSIIENKILMLF
jgi:hypothetical protein